MDTALRSGYTNPDDFWRLPGLTQSLLTVYWEVKDSMRYVEERESSKQMNKASSGDKGINKD